MTRELTPSILQAPIASLSFSNEFKVMADANGFDTIQQVLSEPLHTLPQRKLSGYRMLKELLDFLEAHNLHGDWED
ncbi:MAG TPA: hypothetical protein VFE57_07300 [Cyclobacteriaceae bacterium]|jgi:hypothetical protein|nr:hypothetical protein [Cyclobacteriaceae bacterium]